MTGLERLRDIAEDRYSGGLVHISVHKLREICDQIEAEAGVETVKSEAMEALAFVEEHGGLDELRKRLAPGVYGRLLGIDGSPIVPGGVYYGQSDGKRWRVDAVGTLFAWAGLSKTARMRGEGPKRLRPEWLSKEPPAHKVFDADGVEIHKGDTVWSLGGGGPYTVAGFDGGTPYVLCDNGKGNVPALEPSALTHRAPVRAADGKLLREGETVYDVNDAKGFPGIVKSTRLDRFGRVKVTCEEPTPATVYIHPCRLTHERPDSWERWEADLRRSEMCEEACDDLVRRAKALAERGA